MWGFLPLYFNALGPRVSAWEILVHRALWAVPLLVLFVLVSRRGARVRAVFADRRKLLALCVSAALITANWGIFIWAVTHGHVLESSLGYYINPLLNVLMGFCFLHERLRPLQSIAVAIATVGVMIMIIGYGHVPWIALSVAGCFGCYGLIRKQVVVDSVSGLLVETLVLAPGALLWLAWMYAHHEATFLLVDRRIDFLLFGCGVVTVVPLVLFADAARRLRLGTLGLLQYITPTLQLLSGVFVLGEAFTRADGITFACIWIGLMIYTADTLRAQRRRAAFARVLRPED